MKNRVLTKTTLLPAEKDVIFRRMKQLKTLQYIASPYATFIPVSGENDLIWEEGQTLSFHFKLFGVIPFGVHTIHVNRFCEETCEVDTSEYNPHVPVWNHHIYLTEAGGDGVQYTDEVELNAGWKTPFVYLWACAFYRHRQKKWLKLLRDS